VRTPAQLGSIAKIARKLNLKELEDKCVDVYKTSFPEEIINIKNGDLDSKVIFKKYFGKAILEEIISDVGKPQQLNK
jgi:hypothetical protein